MSYWALVITQTNKERLAVQNISNQGYEYYLPLFREKVTKNEKTQDVAKVLFARYVFVKIHRQWASLTGTYGVSSLVMDGSSPKVVPERVIQKLREREDTDGFVLLDDEDNGLKENTTVKVKDGPLKDHLGLYKRMSNDERAVVLFRLLGSEREIKIDPQLLMVT